MSLEFVSNCVATILSKRDVLTVGCKAFNGPWGVLCILKGRQR
jgi:hypothetical protein